MNHKKELLKHIHKLHTTELGQKRIQKNLDIFTEDIVKVLKELIIKEECIIYKNGKNYYCEIDNIRITINSSNYCIITVHRIKKGEENE